MPLRLEMYLPIVAANKSKARQLFDLIRTSPYQQRHVLQWDDTLARVATAHCKDMAVRNYFGHVSPDGVGANQRVLNAGYKLPAVYKGGTANYVESLAAGDPTVEGTMSAWFRSPGHRPHVFGETDFWRTQTVAACGYAEGGYYKRYWCFLSCHKEGDEWRLSGNQSLIKM